MSSFHDQWMAAWDLVAGLTEGELRQRLRDDLARARELIGADDGPTRRRGGEVVRGVCLRVRAMEVLR